MSLLRNWYRFLSPNYQALFLEYKTAFAPRYSPEQGPHEGLQKIVSDREASYKVFITDILRYKDDLQAIRPADVEKDASLPAWNNGFLPGLDIAVIYTMLASKKSQRYMEVGSGNSTKVARYAIDKNGLETEILSIDPYPRAEIDALAHRIVRKRLEDTSLDVFSELEKGDILFIDNSHRVLPNSDAMVFFMEILPRLRPGVIVHVHDIYIPFDYPQFMCDRFYSEQYALACFLLANPAKYKILMPNFYVSENADLAVGLEELWNHENLIGVERHGGSFWFEISA